MEDKERIIKVDIEQEMRKSYIDYSMSVIVARALPDVRDGFKPVHRRILFGMKELGNVHSKPYKKSARIVGEVLGKYHPHGDSSVYGALVRMAQEWAMRYTLVDGQGNFGSIDGDSPAAMRYTEARLSLMGEAMMDDLDKDTVDMTMNFDDTLPEPTVMPTKIPNLLVNGATGIAVGMATNIPTHNLSEVIDACVAYIDNEDMDVEALMQYVKGPDFPTGAYIMGLQGIKDAYETGRGRVIMRAKTEIEAGEQHGGLQGGPVECAEGFDLPGDLAVRGQGQAVFQGQVGIALDERQHVVHELRRDAVAGLVDPLPGDLLLRVGGQGQVLGQLVVKDQDGNSYGPFRLVANTDVAVSRIELMRQRLQDLTHGKAFKFIFWGVIVILVLYAAFETQYRVRRAKQRKAEREARRQTAASNK